MPEDGPWGSASFPCPVHPLAGNLGRRHLVTTHPKPARTRQDLPSSPLTTRHSSLHHSVPSHQYRIAGLGGDEGWRQKPRDLPAAFLAGQAQDPTAR